MTDPRQKLPDGHNGPWVATFRDGPLADQSSDRVFAVGPIWQEIELAPLSRHGYVIVGGSNMPASEPWPGMVRYRLADVLPMAAGHGEPVAYYEQANG